MGTDIHAAIECFNGGRWQAHLFPNKYFGKWDDEKPETARLDIDRNYDAFAILANVRNGRGFAGCVTSEPFQFMSDRRGVPDDISDEAKAALSGEHSATYVTLAEMLAFDWTRTNTLTGYVNAVTFEQWDRCKRWQPRPKEYCGDVSGGTTQKISESAMRDLVQSVIGDKRGTEYQHAIQELRDKHDRVYTRIFWEERYTEAAGQIWMEVFPLMLKLSQQFKDVRLVMDFDS